MQVTVNMSTATLVSRLIIWVVIVNPITKFALDLAPIARGLEGFLLVSWQLDERGKLFAALSAALRVALVDHTSNLNYY